MYKVLNSSRMNNLLYYSVSDGTDDLEFLSEIDLKMLIYLGVDLHDKNNNKLVLNENDEIIGDIEDITSQMAQSVDDDDDDLMFELTDDEREELEDDDFDYADDYETDDEFSEVNESEDSDLDYDDFEVDEDEESEEEDDSEEGMDIEFDSIEDFDDFESDDENEDVDEDLEDIYDDDFEDSIDEEDSVVKKLYALLSDEQVKILKRYYLWYSRRFFDSEAYNCDISTRFKVQSNFIRKQKKLKELRGDSEYRYVGYIDTGSVYFGAKCSLGHPIRYIHIAWDIKYGDIDTMFFGEDYNADFERLLESEHCITFGIRCMGDFFEKNAEFLRVLTRVQNRSLKDMELLYTIYAGNNVEDAKKSLEPMDRMLKRIKVLDAKQAMVEDKPFLPRETVLLYEQFRNMDMLPPKSLVQEIRSCIVGWTDGNNFFENKWVSELKVPNLDVFRERLVKLFGKEYEDLLKHYITYGKMKYYYSGIDSSLYNYITLLFCYKICGVYAFNAQDSKDEGGTSAIVRSTLGILTDCNLSSKFDSPDYSLEYCKKLLLLASMLLKKDISDFSAKVISGEGYSEDEYSYADIVNLDYYGVDTSDVSEYFKDEIHSINIIKSVFNDIHSHFYSYNRRYRDKSEIDYGDEHYILSNLDSSIDLLNRIYSDFESLKVNVDNKVESFNENKKKEIADKIAKREEEKRLEEERKRKEEEERLEQERLRKEKEEAEAKVINTRDKVIKFLGDSDLSAFDSDTSYALGVKLVNQFKDSSKKPSDKQFKHIQRLYESLTKVPYRGDGYLDFITLDTRPDIVDALNKADNDKSLLDKTISHLGRGDVDKLSGIIFNIRKYGIISTSQAAYTNALLEVIAEGDK